MIFKLYLWTMGFVAAVGIFMSLVTNSNGLEYILYEDLTCDELVASYHFNYEVLEDMIKYHDECIDYIDPSLDGNPHGGLMCGYLKEHGIFVEGILNDLAAVHNIKCTWTNE